MKNKLTILFLFLSVICLGQSVPNTNTFHLTDVRFVVGGNSLQQVFANSVDSCFDPLYKGAKDRLLNFRNYTIVSNDTVAPAQISNLRVVSKSSTLISIAWDIPTDNSWIDHYLVSWHKVNDSLTISLNTDINFFTIHNLRANTSYVISVSAVDANNNVGLPSSITASTDAVSNDTIPPSAVTGLKVVGKGSYNHYLTIVLSWDTCTDNRGVYYYQVSYNIDGLTNKLYTTTSSMPLEIDNLYAKKYYDFTVAAVDSSGNVGASQTIMNYLFTPTWNNDMTAPSAITGLTGNAVSSSEIGLHWNASTDNIGIYCYLVSVKKPGATTWNDFTSFRTWYNVYNLTTSTTYDISVYAVDWQGNLGTPQTIEITTP